MVRDKKEFRKLEAEEIVRRLDNFMDTQKLDVSAKYFIVKQMMDNYWDDIKIDDDKDLDGFYEDEDFVDHDEDDDVELVDTLPDDFDDSLEPSNNEQAVDSSDEDLSDNSQDALLEPVDSLDDDVDSLLAEVDEDKTVEENKAKEKVAKANAKKAKK